MQNKFMFDQVARFLTTRCQPDASVLLAFSGGSDSVALLQLLLEFRQRHPLKLALAHVDHGWRKESDQEAKKIVEMAEKLKLPVHIKKLDPLLMKGNLEAACREERLRFFASLCSEYGYQAVLLAHHADDVAETVLKRVLEGATLSYLSPLNQETYIYGIKIWRPLLAVSKQQILSFLKEKELKWIDDKTNRDPKFLRARFRLQILPYLSEVFGKKVSPGLCQIATEARELRDYLDDQVRTYMDKVVVGSWGSFLDLSGKKPSSLFEFKYLVRQFCKESSFALSRESIHQVVQLTRERIANKSFICNGEDGFQILYIDRGRLFIPKRNLPLLSEDSLQIFEGKDQFFGEWKIRMIACSVLKNEKPTSWLDLWKKGKGEVILPQGSYHMGAPDSCLSKFWTAQKIPSFLRKHVPVVFKGNDVIHEFLSGERKNGNFTLSKEWIKLTISYEQS